MGADITPSLEQYSEAIDFLSRKIKSRKFSGISKITESFRISYYCMVKEVLKTEKQLLPCYAGFASVHIAPDGDVWTCCIRAEPMGNLRDTDYDFTKVWFSDKAKQLRRTKEKQTD